MNQYEYVYLDHLLTDAAVPGLRFLGISTSPMQGYCAADRRDAPYMIPAWVYSALEPKHSRLPFAHSLVIPWMTELVAVVMDDSSYTERVLTF
ncbi:hypothetical protein EDD85DRAFT_943452 [Armillaria nabsnona]|nr:hypothetical protein EDD85DRAFT_943452 [Armillaria nabsnona]